MTAKRRALMPDYLRLVSLFGIVIVNVQYMAFSALGSFSKSAGVSFGDKITLWLINGLVLFKTYGLFSFMFGVGFGFLMRSAAQRGLPFGRLYRNRIIGLFLLGVFHGCLFFPGDILAIYAVTGSILYLFRDWPVRRLAGVGAALLVMQIAVAIPMILAVPETSADIVALEREILTRGSFADAILFRSIGFAFTLPFLLIMQGTATLGWFCFGLAAAKSGIIDDTHHSFWSSARRWCLWPGTILSLVGAAIWQWGAPIPGVVLTLVSAPVATLGYLGLMAALARPPGDLMARVLPAGGCSLSIYLGQSMLLSTLFSGYGLGLWNTLDRLTASGVAVAVTSLLIIILSTWRRRFALGPLEWVLRRVTFAGLGARQSDRSF